MTDHEDDRIPPPFAGWLEEHPDGAFLLVYEDGDRVTILSYEELEEQRDRDEAAGRSPVQVARVRVARALEDIDLDDPSTWPWRQQKLYPPDA